MNNNNQHKKYHYFLSNVKSLEFTCKCFHVPHLSFLNNDMIFFLMNFERFKISSDVKELFLPVKNNDPK